MIVCSCILAELLTDAYHWLSILTDHLGLAAQGGSRERMECLSATTFDHARFFRNPSSYVSPVYRDAPCVLGSRTLCQS